MKFKNNLLPLLLTMIFLPLAPLTVHAAGTLRVHPGNPRYFTDDSGKAIYLTGSHTWAQTKDGFDFNAYLNMLQSNNHNFFRLWSADYSIASTPSPYLRTGPGKALDGKPKVNLDHLNPAYFNRVRSHVIAARSRGFYVAVNLFPLDSMKNREDWKGSPFHKSNNVQDINGDPNGDGRGAEAFNLSIPRITSLQEAFARRMVDTLNDLDNVLYEIGNEGDKTSIPFQYHFVRYVKNYEGRQSKRHPVGMSAAFDWMSGSQTSSNQELFNSPADWIAPGLSPYQDNPPAATGKKVIIADVDHIWPKAPISSWFWKCFARGLNPILMDWYTYGNPIRWSTGDQNKMRKYMGHTLTYSRKVNLAEMDPRQDLATTGYALVNPGKEYLVYQPGSGSFKVNLQPGTYTQEWFDPSNGKMRDKSSVTLSGGHLSFSAPFNGEAVLHLKIDSAPSPTPKPTPTPTPTPTPKPTPTPTPAPIPPHSQKPVASWTFDEGSGSTASDASGNGNFATLTNRPDWVAGVRGQALEFDGNRAYVRIEDSDDTDFGTSNFSAAAWFKRANNNTYGTIMADGETEGHAQPDYWELRLNNNGTLRFVTESNGQNTGATTNAGYADNRWHHVAVVRAGTNHAIFVDGVLRASGNGPALNVNNDEPLTLGVAKHSSMGGFVRNPLNGALDEVQLYNRALSYSEIQSLAKR